MGPVAPFILEDKLAEFELGKEQFPKDKAGAFIESISEEIPQESKRKEFLGAMEDFLLRDK
jgi:hypothetical protein